MLATQQKKVEVSFGEWEHYTQGERVWRHLAPLLREEKSSLFICLHLNDCSPILVWEELRLRPTERFRNNGFVGLLEEYEPLTP